MVFRRIHMHLISLDIFLFFHQNLYCIKLQKAKSYRLQIQIRHFHKCTFEIICLMPKCYFILDKVGSGLSPHLCHCEYSHFCNCPLHIPGKGRKFLKVRKISFCTVVTETSVPIKSCPPLFVLLTAVLHYI